MNIARLARSTSPPLRLDLEAGRYEFVVPNPESKMPSLRGEFEVTAR